MGYYAASSGSFLPAFRVNLSGPIFKSQDSRIQGFLTLEYGTDTLTWNVDKNYHYYLRNSVEECSSHLLSGGSLKSRTKR